MFNGLFRNSIFELTITSRAPNRHDGSYTIIGPLVNNFDFPLNNSTTTTLSRSGSFVAYTLGSCLPIQTKLFIILPKGCCSGSLRNWGVKNDNICTTMSRRVTHGIPDNFEERRVGLQASSFSEVNNWGGDSIVPMV